MYHGVDLSEIQRVVGQYASRANLPVAAGPIAAASVAKMFASKNKLVNLGMVGGGVWFAVQELSGPILNLLQDQFGYLQSVFGAFRG